MHTPIERVLIDIRGGQLGELEQRRLQVFGALALQDFHLQAAIGLGQLQRAQLHALLQILLALLALQRGEDMAADELQQGQILVGETDVLLIALHHQRTAGLTVA